MTLISLNIINLCYWTVKHYCTTFLERSYWIVQFYNTTFLEQYHWLVQLGNAIFLDKYYCINPFYGSTLFRIFHCVIYLFLNPKLKPVWIWKTVWILRNFCGYRNQSKLKQASPIYDNLSRNCWTKPKVFDLHLNWYW